MSPLQSKSDVSDFDNSIKCRTQVNPNSNGERVVGEGVEPIEGPIPSHPTTLPMGRGSGTVAARKATNAARKASRTRRRPPPAKTYDQDMGQYIGASEGRVMPTSLTIRTALPSDAEALTAYIAAIVAERLPALFGAHTRRRRWSRSRRRSRATPRIRAARSSSRSRKAPSSACSTSHRSRVRSSAMSGRSA